MSQHELDVKQINGTNKQINLKCFCFELTFLSQLTNKINMFFASFSNV